MTAMTVTLTALREPDICADPDIEIMDANISTQYRMLNDTQ